MSGYDNPACITDTPYLQQHLRRAVSSEKPVHIHYENAYGELSERWIEPLGVYCRCGKWYVRAYCRLRGEERTFALRRMELVEAEHAITAHSIAGDEAKSEVKSKIDLEVVRGNTSPAHASRRRNAPSPIYLLLGILFFCLGSFSYIQKTDTTAFLPDPEWVEMPKTEIRSSALDGEKELPVKKTDPNRLQLGSYRNQYIFQTAYGGVEAPEFGLRAESRRDLHYLINARLFWEKTDIDDVKLWMRYIHADKDRNGHLSWEEVVEFQRETRRYFSYTPNDQALPPDEFLRRGGGDCEDFALYTCGMLQFWGWNSKVAAYYSPGGDSGHAVAFIWSNHPIKDIGYVKIEAGTFLQGEEVRPGYWIPIDYENVGNFSTAMASDWELLRLYEPQEIYWREM